MPTCHLILSRHLGAGLHKAKSKPFALEALRPIVESHLASGKPLHIIHDAMYVDLPPQDEGHYSNFVLLPQQDRLTRFEAKLSEQRFMSGIERKVREFRVMMTAQLENPQDTDYDDAPEMQFIMETKRSHPGAIINHLGFYSSEASLEMSRALLSGIMAMDLEAKKDHSGAVKHILLSNDAVASAALLRDTDLVRQISKIGSDVVVFRNLSHAYLTDIENRDFPIVANGKITTMAKLYETHSIDIDAEMEAADLTFSELAVNKLCLGLIDAPEQMTLAFMQLFFLGYMAEHDLWKADNGVESGIAAVNSAYAQMVSETKRKEVRQ